MHPSDREDKAMSEQQTQERIASELKRMSDTCERGVIAEAVTEEGIPVAGFALVNPNCIVFAFMPIPGMILDFYLN